MARKAYTSLTGKVKRRMDSAVRNRGAVYFAQGAVGRLRGDDQHVEATVRGSRPYSVQLRYQVVANQEAALVAFCDCPYFDSNAEACKHIWATLLAAESRGLLSAALDVNSLTLIPDWEALDDVNGDYDEGDEDEGDGEDDVWEVVSHEDAAIAGRAPRARSLVRPRSNRSAATRRRGWRDGVAALRDLITKTHPTAVREAWPADQQVLYVIDAAATLTSTQGLVVQTVCRRPKMDGQWSKIRNKRIGRDLAEQLPDPADRRIVSLLHGGRLVGGYAYSAYGYNYGYGSESNERYILAPQMQETLVPMMCRTGRCLLQTGGQELDALATLPWDEGPTWQLWLTVTRQDKADAYVLRGELRRGDGQGGDQRMPLSQPTLLTIGGLLIAQGSAAPFDCGAAFPWVLLLREQGELIVPAGEADQLLEGILTLPAMPPLDLPQALRFVEAQGEPRPRLRIGKPKSGDGRQRTSAGRLIGELSFSYGDELIAWDDLRRGLFDVDSRRLTLRDPSVERDAEQQLRRLGFADLNSYERDRQNGRLRLSLAPRHLPKVVPTLVEAGWYVEADGNVYRRPGAFSIALTSGIDWFEMHGSLQFGDQAAALPELLRAARKGDNTVRLGDGSVGMLPDDWLERYGRLVGFGKEETDHVRFARTQVGLLDAMLAAMPEVDCDAQFRQVRDKLRQFDGVKPKAPVKTFTGTLRDYQCDGLGWLDFLNQFGFGGCLADDMGLGKTVQVLALLESRRQRRRRKARPDTPPSLVVVPRSLVWNWQQEAARFTPSLRVLAHVGLKRDKTPDRFDEHDLIVTTYGTLRRDIGLLKEVHFDYVILDEAQAVKNANTASAKATRLLRADHRLAMTGTPVENHLGELWSLFEFLNPGMLGSANVFRRFAGATASAAQSNGDASACDDAGNAPNHAVLARSLRPFLLRRTKEQVASDLPQKSEQTLYCDLEGKQRRQYDELRDHYRRSLLKRVDTQGIAKSKMYVLEALLRLRQAACHPGLIDKSKRKQTSAKLDALLPQVSEVIDEGHKVLVFSQFTSMLAIVRDRLDEQGVTYEYLDGRTRDRAARVDRFQSDADCKLFLISLKAGGVGLNLTAADYVFLLDPWWNPAVEAQAIDRTHRIGQGRRVFAYRIIARDTVEEKVLALQQAKRDLADAIITADNSLIRRLGREDLELLLS